MHRTSIDRSFDVSGGHVVVKNSSVYRYPLLRLIFDLHIRAESELFRQQIFFQLSRTKENHTSIAIKVVTFRHQLCTLIAHVNTINQHRFSNVNKGGW